MFRLQIIKYYSSERNKNNYRQRVEIVTGNGKVMDTTALRKIDN
jgi:hypothetical protein